VAPSSEAGCGIQMHWRDAGVGGGDMRWWQRRAVGVAVPLAGGSGFLDGVSGDRKQKEVHGGEEMGEGGKRKGAGDF
jgi:hypothetical protein